MPEIRNSYGQGFVHVAGKSIAPGRTAFINANHWSSWITHSGNAELAAKFLEIVEGEDVTPITLPKPNRSLDAATEYGFEDPAPAQPVEDAQEGAQGAQEAPPAPAPDASGTDVPEDTRTREECLDDVVSQLMEAGSPDQLTQAGKPRMPVVKELMGDTTVTAEEVTASLFRYEQRKAAEDGS